MALPLLSLGFLLVALGTNLIFGPGGAVQPTGYAIAGAVALLPLAEALFLLAVGLRRAGPQRQVGLLLLGLLFFSLSTALLLAPTRWLPRPLLLLGMGVDLLLLGLVAAALDAFQEGEAWLLGTAAVFLAGCVAWFLLHSRFERISPKLVRGIAFFNVDAAILFWLIALFGWFGLNSAARWVLAGVGDLTLILGLIQFYALRKARS